MEQKIKDEQNMESTKYKILIAPWGNPNAWNEVTYVYNEKEIISSTSLKVLHEEINPSKTIIIGPITLANMNKSLKDAELSYNAILNNSKDFIANYASKNNLNIDSSDIIIAPGIGSFPNGIFKGNALDYYYFILYKLIKEIEESIEAKQYIEIHLDVTYGLNYMTILTYRAVKEIIGVLSIFHNLVFHAYNADPFARNSEKKLRINVIEQSKGIPTPYNENFSKKEKNLIESISLSNDEKRELFNSNDENSLYLNNEKKNEFAAFIGSIYNGLPLAMFTLFPDLKEINNYLQRALQIYEKDKYININVKNDKIILKRRVMLTKNFKVLSFLKLITVLLNKNAIIKQRDNEIELSRISQLFSKKNNQKKVKFELGVLKEELILAEIKSIQNKINGIKNALNKSNKERQSFNWISYNRILEGNNAAFKESKISEKDKSINNRNFIAHAGFERNAIEIKKIEDKIVLRYNLNKINIIKKLCQYGLIDN